LINTIGSVAGIVSPILTGLVVKLTGSFRLALTVGGCSMLTAMFFTLVVVPKLALLDLGSTDLQISDPVAQAAKV
jgi:hypothetical protein